MEKDASPGAIMNPAPAPRAAINPSLTRHFADLTPSGEFMGGLRRLGAVNAIVIGTLGAIVAGGVYFIDAPTWEVAPPFVKTTEFYYWVLLHCAQGALWFVLAAPLTVWLRELRPFWAGNKLRIWSSVVVLVALIATFVVLSAGMTPEYGFPGMQIKIMVLAPFPILLAVGGAIGVWLVDGALGSGAGGSPTEDGIREYLWLRDRSGALLALLAAVLASAILNLVVLRNAVLAAHSSTDAQDIFPPQLILLHGTFFSLLLAFGYAPTYLRFRSIGLRMREELFGVPASGSNGWSSWHQNRDAFEKVMELQPGANPTARTVAKILSPAGTAILAYFNIG